MLAPVAASAAEWIALDNHAHSVMSGGEERTETLTRRAESFGLGAFVLTDHGGRADVAVDGARLSPPRWRWELLRGASWPLVASLRDAHPGTLLVQGLEWNVPTHEHAAVAIVGEPDGGAISEFEYRFDAADADQSREAEWGSKRNRTHADAVEALRWLARTQGESSWAVVNHPSRSRAYSARDLRDLAYAGPVAIGIEGFPGHQRERTRGGYGGACGDPRTTAQVAEGTCRSRTFGGADWMLAKVGGVMDALWGEGRRFWIVVDSDFHATANDFWPGEYAKTWVRVAERSGGGLVRGLRSGNLFVVHGDLLNGLELSAARVHPGGGQDVAEMGSSLEVRRGDDVEVRLRLRSPERNAHGDAPRVDHVDVIVGEGPERGDRAADENPTTRVYRRIFARDLRKEAGGWSSVSVRIPAVRASLYVRLRGTNLPVGAPGQLDPDGNPRVDPIAKDRAAAEAEAWADLWFYSNPVFVRVR
jgi:hypothetical protein